MDETDISIFGKKKPQKEKTDMAHSSKNDEDTQTVSSKAEVKVPFRSVPTRDDEYNSNHKKLGIALIFNHKEVRGQEPRKGTSRDRDRVKGALKSLGFDVRTFDELTFEKLSGQLKEVASEDHSDNDCLVVVVMSHGIEGKVFAKDMAYPVERLWTPFLGNNCKSLINKPKMFFIQACRGSKLDKPVSFTPMSRLSADETKPVNYVIPTTADLLVFYSTFEGHYSFRNVENGAWFIQCLCMVLEEVAAKNAEEGIELFRLLTAVNRKVAFEYQSMTTRQETNEMKEMPNFLSTLTKTFYLKIKKTSTTN